MLKTRKGKTHRDLKSIRQENHNFHYYYCHSPEFLNSIETLLSYKLMSIIRLFTTTSLIALIVVAGGSMIITPPINAQENATSFSQSQNTTTATTNTTGVAEETTYILIFGHRIVGNIDNSTKIVSSIVGDNSTKIQEEFLEEISLAPSQQLEEQVNRVVNDGISGLPCADVSLVTEQGENLSVECISSGNTIIWHIYSTP